MATALGRQTRIGQRTQRSGSIKTEPGLSVSSTAVPISSRRDVIAVDQSFTYPAHRSNAPPPSTISTDRNTESDRPLLREVRNRPDTPAMSPQNVEDSFLNNSFRGIGNRLKACNDTLGELQQLGVSHKVKLPELVLVGDQSAGKSTLMSGLANLELPRSEGTCTRCPLHIRVSRRNEWSCKVSLRKAYAYQPPEDREIQDSDVTGQDPFFPWKKMGTTAVVEFKTMSDQNEIESVLRWAQVAILNDHRNPELFIPGSGPIPESISIDDAAAAASAKFSPNIVALEIMGPDLPDLSFYDMPGVFHNPADARDDYLVHVVRNLSCEYINHTSAIILCGVAMNNDAENSYSMNLVRRLGAAKRTIGVLTKADLLSPAGHEQWLKIMKGDNHRTGLGWFITSRPPGRLLDQLSQYETCFFETRSSENWPKIFEPFSDRCGMEKLKAFLSERLALDFANSLPKIKHSIIQLRDSTEKELSNLPEMPDNVEKEISVSLRSFGDRASTRIDAFCNGFNMAPLNFRECLIHIKPKFVLKDASDIPPIVIPSDDSDDGASTASVTTPSKRRANGHSQALAKRPRPDSQHGSASFNMSNARSVKPEEDQNPGVAHPSSIPMRRFVLPVPFAKYTDVGRGFRTLAQVRQEKLKKTRAGMPGRLLDGIYDDLAKEAIKPWDGPAKDFLTFTMSQLQLELDKVVADAFGTLKKRLVFQEVKKHMKACLAEHSAVAQNHIKLLYEDERSGILTFNMEAFSHYKEEEMAILEHFRHYQRMHPYGASPTPPPQWTDLKEDKRAQALKQREIDIARIGVDSFADEIGIITYVRAYYKLAALRFADSVSQIILRRLIPGIKQDLSFFIEQRLGLRDANPQAVFDRLMEEDSKIAAKRIELKSERDKCMKALDSIRNLESGVGRDGTEEYEEEDLDMSMEDVDIAEA